MPREATIAKAALKRPARKPVRPIARVVAPEAVPDSTTVLQSVESLKAYLERWLSRKQFQPWTLLNEAAAAAGNDRARLLADAQNWYYIRGVLRACRKAA